MLHVLLAEAWLRVRQVYSFHGRKDLRLADAIVLDFFWTRAAPQRGLFHQFHPQLILKSLALSWYLKIFAIFLLKRPQSVGQWFVSETWSSSRQLRPDFATVMSTSLPSLQLPWKEGFALGRRNCGWFLLKAHSAAKGLIPSVSATANFQVFGFVMILEVICDISPWLPKDLSKRKLFLFGLVGHYSWSICFIRTTYSLSGFAAFATQWHLGYVTSPCSCWPVKEAVPGALDFVSSWFSQQGVAKWSPKGHMLSINRAVSCWESMLRIQATETSRFAWVHGRNWQNRKGGRPIAHSKRNSNFLIVNLWARRVSNLLVCCGMIALLKFPWPILTLFGCGPHVSIFRESTLEGHLKHVKLSWLWSWAWSTTLRKWNRMCGSREEAPPKQVCRSAIEPHMNHHESENFTSFHSHYSS